MTRAGDTPRRARPVRQPGQRWLGGNGGTEKNKKVISQSQILAGPGLSIGGPGLSTVRCQLGYFGWPRTVSSQVPAKVFWLAPDCRLDGPGLSAVRCQLIYFGWHLIVD